MTKSNTENSESNHSFLRAARAGNLSKVIDFLDTGTDINTCNDIGLSALHLAAKEGHVNIVNELIKRGPRIDATTKKGNSALHIASLAGKFDVVKILVENNANVNLQSTNGFTPLYMAAQENHLDVVTFLINNGADQTITTEDGFTPLAVALQQGHERVVGLLLENDNRSKQRLPALHIAVKKNDVNAVNLLLNSSEVDVNHQSSSGFTPLHIAAHYGNEKSAQLLIEQKADVNFQAKNNITPLHVAAKWGRSGMVQLLIESGALVSCRTRDGLTPLHCSARSGHAQLCEKLIDNGADVMCKTRNGLTSLHMAAQGDFEDTARILLLKRANINETTTDFLTPLHVTAHYGNEKVARILLDRRCDPNARALNGFTPLHIACKKHKIKIVELLLKYGALIEATTETGLTPLHVSAFIGSKEAVTMLLQKSANIEQGTMRGETALHLATRNNQTETVKLLLKAGAIPDAKARENQTPLHVATKIGNIELVTLFLQDGADPNVATRDNYTALHVAAKEGRNEIIGLLLDNGAKIEAETKRGFTPLHIAAKYDKVAVASTLLKRNANPTATGKNGLTPLHVATHYNHEKVAQLLLDSKADPKCKAKNGYTPLHIAAKKNNMDLATMLLAADADSNAESRNGFSPLQLASQEGHTDIVSLLLQHRADVNHKAKNGLTSMHLAAQEDKVAVARILVHAGADIIPTTTAEYTPLHTAAHFGQINMTKYLISLMNHDEINKRTQLGFTPLHLAAQQGHLQVVTILLDNYADPNIKNNQGWTAAHIARKQHYLNIFEVLRKVTTEVISWEIEEEETEEIIILEKPENMGEHAVSDSEDEGEMSPKVPKPEVENDYDTESFDKKNKNRLFPDDYEYRISTSNDDIWRDLEYMKNGSAKRGNEASSQSVDSKDGLHVFKLTHRREPSQDLDSIIVSDIEFKSDFDPNDMENGSKSSRNIFRIPYRKTDARKGIVSQEIESIVSTDDIEITSDVFTTEVMTKSDNEWSINIYPDSNKLHSNEDIESIIDSDNQVFESSKDKFSQDLKSFKDNDEDRKVRVVVNSLDIEMKKEISWGVISNNSLDDNKDISSTNFDPNEKMNKSDIIWNDSVKNGQNQDLESGLNNKQTDIVPNVSDTNDSDASWEFIPNVSINPDFESKSGAEEDYGKNVSDIFKEIDNFFNMQSENTGNNLNEISHDLESAMITDIDSNSDIESIDSDDKSNIITDINPFCLPDDFLPGDESFHENTMSREHQEIKETDIQMEKNMPCHASEDLYGKSDWDFEPDNVQIIRKPVSSGFLVSFMIDARGGCMQAQRFTNLRFYVPPSSALGPTRLVCRLIKPSKMISPPALNDGDGFACRIMEMGPCNMQLNSPILIEVPHYASLRGREREIIILRSDNGETWKEHPIEASDQAIQNSVGLSFDKLMTNEEVRANRIQRILTTDLPQYFALISRIRQEVALIGPEGVVMSSSVVPQVQAVFPEGALLKKTRVGIQAHEIPTEIVTRLLGNRVACSPIISIEPRRRKFHKPITLTVPLPKTSNRGMLNDQNSGTSSLRLLCSITGGSAPAVWEDITGSTPLSFLKDCVSFTTTVSARLWLIDCPNVQGVAEMATNVYKESIVVPYMGQFVVYGRRHDKEEAQFRILGLTDDSVDKTLECQENFQLVASGPLVELLHNRPHWIETAGNLVPVTKTGDQLSMVIEALNENRISFLIRVKDIQQEPKGKLAILLHQRNQGLGPGSALGTTTVQKPITTLEISLPNEIVPVSDTLRRKKMKAGEFIKTTMGIEKVAKSELDLRAVADDIGGDWPELAMALGITDPDDLKNIKSNSSDRDAAYAVLILWKSRNGDLASGNELERVLRDIGREDVVKSCMFNISFITNEDEKKEALKGIDKDNYMQYLNVDKPGSVDESMVVEVGDDTASQRENDIQASDYAEDGDDSVITAVVHPNTILRKDGNSPVSETKTKAFLELINKLEDILPEPQLPDVDYYEQDSVHEDDVSENKLEKPVIGQLNESALPSTMDLTPDEEHQVESNIKSRNLRSTFAEFIPNENHSLQTSPDDQQVLCDYERNSEQDDNLPTGTCESEFRSYRVSTLSPSFSSELKQKLLISDTDDDFSFVSDSDSVNFKVNVPIYKHPGSPVLRSMTPVKIKNNRKNRITISNKIRTTVIDLEENSNFSKGSCTHHDFEQQQHTNHCAQISVEEIIDKYVTPPKTEFNRCHLSIQKVFDHTCNAPTISEKHLSLKSENVEFVQTEKVVSDNFLIKGELRLYHANNASKPLFSSESSSECNFDCDDEENLLAYGLHQQLDNLGSDDQ